MFTGLIEEVGRVGSIESDGDGARIGIEADLTDRIAVGDSVAVNGCCLTAVEVGGGRFGVEAVNQTLELTALRKLAGGDGVNLELALRAGDRLGGHIVQGHVDGVGEAISLEPDGIGSRLRVGLDDRLERYVVAQGSIAIEGVSLTVADLSPRAERDRAWVEVALIPETMRQTTLGAVRAGDALNLECDLIAKHVERMVSPYGDELEQMREPNRE